MQQAAELRRAKEQFVSNLHGTTKWEVFCVVSCLPLCLLIGEDTYLPVSGTVWQLLPAADAGSL
jgi:hypothetical protein